MARIKVKRLVPSFDGAVRFIPVKYQQRITEFYTLIFKKSTPSGQTEACSFGMLSQLSASHFGMRLFLY
jgi:hypothetical protein